MPVLKVFYDEALDETVRTHRAEMTSRFETMMRERLKADPRNCQVVMAPASHMSPTPVYVDMQFRANDYRSREVVEQAMRDISDAVQGALGTSVRIRSFDIDQATLHALDVEEPAQP